MHCSDFVFIIGTICKGKMALGTSVKAAIEKYSAKVGLGSPAISKMEIFVTLYDSQKNVISDAAGILDLPGDINSLFVLIIMLTLHTYKKEICPLVIFFSEKLINKNF